MSKIEMKAGRDWDHALKDASASGLDEVVAAETALSDVDGQAGRLIVAGHKVEALAETHDFEAAAAELWRAAGLDPAPEAEEVRDLLGRSREDAYRLVPALLAALREGST